MQATTQMRLDDTPISTKDRLESIKQSFSYYFKLFSTFFRWAWLNTPNYLRSIVPMSQWLRYYNFRWLWSDIFSGITMTLVLIPQSIAYAKMMNIPAQYGLYSAALSPVLYGISATCREASVGPTAILAGTMSKSLARIVAANPHLSPEVVANSLAVCVGAIMIILGFLRAGDLIDFIPKSITMGFINGTALSIFVSQLPKLLGVPVDSTADSTPILIYNIFKNLHKINYVDLLFGVGSIIMYIVLCKINTKFNLKIKYLLTLIVICVFMLTAFCIFKFHPDFKLSILRQMDINFRFTFPTVQPEIWAEAQSLVISIFLVCTMEHTAVTRKFSTRAMYLVDNSQEWLALGFANFASSCFAGFPVSASLPRSIVQSDCLAKTPISNVITGCLVLVVIYALTSVFYYLPMPIVASVILIASYNLLDPISLWRRLFKINWIDGSIAFIAAALTFLWGIEIGVYTGLGLSLANLLFTLAHPKLLILPPSDSHGGAQPFDVGIPDMSKLSYWMYIQPQEGLLFTNSSRVCEGILDQVLYHCVPQSLPESVDEQIWSPRDVFKRSAKLKSHQIAFNQPGTSAGDVAMNAQLKGIIFNFCHITQLDYTSIQSLIELQILVTNFIQFKSPEPVPFYFIHVKSNVLDALIAGELVSWNKVVWEGAGGGGEGNWGQLIQPGTSEAPRNLYNSIHRNNTIHFNWENLFHYLSV